MSRPLARTARVVLAPILRSRHLSRVAPRPMLWGKTVAPFTAWLPCTASMPQKVGMRTSISLPCRPSIVITGDASQTASASSTQSLSAASLSALGHELPPVRIEPRESSVMGLRSYSPVAASRTARSSSCVIWPTFCSRVIAATIRAMNSS